MNDLTPNSLHAKPTSPELGKALSALLDSEGSPDAAVAGIAADPALVAEVRTALPALKAVAEAKAGEDGVRRVIAKRFEMFPQPQRSDEGWASWWADYFDVLADRPLVSLEAGMRAYVALPDSEFMPKPGKLLELAFSAPSRALTRFYRARRAVDMAMQAERAAIPDPTPEEVAQAAQRAEENRLAILKIAEDFKGKSVGEATRLKPELPSIAGKVDERGITQEMRDLIARREGARA